jgi:hypothetical protein
MQLLPPGSSPPSGLSADEFLLEPLHPSHVQLDYEAVMETRVRLRSWSMSDWPADDFTLDDNMRDLEMHWREHEEGSAFTYTILAPHRSSCLGCVYMKPLAPLFAQEHGAALGEWPSQAARVTFWLRESRITDGLDQRVLQHLIPWFREAWDVESVVFYTSELAGHQQRLFETMGLTQRYVKRRDYGCYLAYR